MINKQTNWQTNKSTVQITRTSLASVIVFLCFTAERIVVTLAVPGLAFAFLGVTEVPFTTFKTDKERRRKMEKERKRHREREK